MTRIKKTRKGGENGPKRKPKEKKSEEIASSKRKRDSGNKAGSRHNEGMLNKASPSGSGRKSSNDPRHGSKKPVALALTDAKPQAKTKQPKLSDEQKLLALEEDPRLNNLLDMLEEGRDLSAEDQSWLDKQLSKIEALMEKLGIADIDEAPAQRPSSDDELLEKFESGAELLKDYQHD